MGIPIRNKGTGNLFLIYSIAVWKVGTKVCRVYQCMWRPCLRWGQENCFKRFSICSRIKFHISLVWYRNNWIRSKLVCKLVPANPRLKKHVVPTCISLVNQEFNMPTTICMKATPYRDSLASDLPSLQQESIFSASETRSLLMKLYVFHRYDITKSAKALIKHITFVGLT